MHKSLIFDLIVVIKIFPRNNKGLGIMSVVNIGINYIFDDYLLVADIYSRARTSNKMNPAPLDLTPMDLTDDCQNVDDINLLVQTSLDSRNYMSKEKYNMIELNSALFSAIESSLIDQDSNDIAHDWGCESKLGFILFCLEMIIILFIVVEIVLS